MTTEEALAAGVDVWGYPKYLADIVIEDSEARYRCRVAVDEQAVLTLEARAVPVAEEPERQVVPVLTVRDPELLSTPVATEGRRGRRDDGERASLVLGEHPQADVLRWLELCPVVAQSRSVEARMLLPAADRRFPLKVAPVEGRH